MKHSRALIERVARAIYETQDNSIPWDSDTLGDWRRDYEREKAEAALDAANYQGAMHLTDAEWDRVLWWLLHPVPPGPMKELDERIISKIDRARGET
jgi:hypothetical protein